MPNGQPTFEFEDNGTRYAVDVNRETETLRVRAASGGVGVTFDLGVVGAQRFSMAMSSALTRLINNGR
jgi:hypothetical protein